MKYKTVKIRRTVCVYYYKTVLLLTTSCRLKELRFLSVVILSDSETFLIFPPCEASPSTFTRTVWPPTFNPRPPNTHTRSTYCCACVSVTWLPSPPPFMSICQNMLHQRVGFADPSRWGGWRGRQILMPEAEDTQLLPTEGNFEHIWGFKFRYVYNSFSELCDFLLLT